MRSRQALVPLLAGLAAAGAAFGVVALTTADGASSTRAHPWAGAEQAHPGRDVFARMGCGSCHRLAAAGSSGDFGPNLDKRLAGHTAESLRAQILAPRVGYLMPTDYRDRMTDRELDALVEFLLASRPPE